MKTLLTYSLVSTFALAAHAGTSLISASRSADGKLVSQKFIPADTKGGVLQKDFSKAATFSAHISKNETSSGNGFRDYTVKFFVKEIDGKVTETRLLVPASKIPDNMNPQIRHGGDGRIEVERTFRTDNGPLSLTQTMGAFISNGKAYRQVTSETLKSDHHTAAVQLIASQPNSKLNEYSVLFMDTRLRSFKGTFQSEHPVLGTRIDRDGELMTVWTLEGNQIKEKDFQLRRAEDNTNGSFIPRSVRTLSKEEILRKGLLAEQTVTSLTQTAPSPVRGMDVQFAK